MNLLEHGKVTRELDKMPIFQDLLEQFETNKPVSGMTIGVVHVYAPNTIPMLQLLINAGANLELILENGLQHDFEIVQYLEESGIDIHKNHPDGKKFDWVIDCGGYFTNHPPVCGGVEVTKTGIHKYREIGATYPLIDVDNTKVKLIETFLGNPEGVYNTLDFFIGDAKFFLEDANVAIIGFGKIGRGSARKFQDISNVLVIDKLPEVIEFAKELEFNTFQLTDDIETNTEKLENYDLIITATGYEGVMSRYFDKSKLKNAMKINLGAIDEWGNQYSEDEIFYSKNKPFNFNLSPPTPSEYIDAILALQALAIIDLITSYQGYKNDNDIIPVSVNLDDKIFQQFLDTHDVDIDVFRRYFPDRF